MPSKAAVELAVKILGEDGELKKALNRSERGLGEFSAGVARVASGANIAFTTVAAGVTAVVAAMHSVAIEAGENARELTRMAASANASVVQIQAAEYATRDLNFEQGKMADILKDVQDKLGDYIATGGGEFADFFENVAPQVGLTANELQRMSGPDALVAVKKAMDAANVSMKEQIFYFESLANDASGLIPLLANNGEQYRQLERDFLSMNTAMTDSEVAKFKQYARDIDDMSDSFDALVREAVAPFLEDMGEIAKYWAQVFGDQRRSLALDNLNTATLIVNGLSTSVQTLRDELDALQRGESVKSVRGDVDKIYSRGSIEQRIELRKKLLAARLEDLELAGQKLQDARKHYNDITTPSTSLPKPDGDPIEPKRPKKEIDELEALQDRSEKALQILDSRFASEQEKIELNHQNRLRSIEELQLSEAELERRGFADMDALRAEYELKSQEYRDERLQSLKLAEDQKALDEYERIAQQFLTKEQIEQNAWLKRQEMLDNAYRQQVITEDTYRAISLKNEKKYQDAINKLETDRMNQRLQNYETLFGSIADVMKTAAGEQSGIYKAMFLASKAFAIAQSIIKIQQGIAEAASLPFPANIPAIGTVISATAGIVSTIQSTSLEGVAHDGIDYVPREGTWLLEKGERVLNPEQNKIFTELADKGSFGGGGVSIVQNYYIGQEGTDNQSGTADNQRTQQLADNIGDVVRKVISDEQRQGGLLAAG